LVAANVCEPRLIVDPGIQLPEPAKTNRYHLDLTPRTAPVSESFRGEVIRVIPPEETADHELEPAMEELAASRSILVCRRGGAPSLLELLWALLRRDPIEPVTIVADLGGESVVEGDEITAEIATTELVGVYTAAGPITVDSA